MPVGVSFTSPVALSDLPCRNQGTERRTLARRDDIVHAIVLPDKPGQFDWHISYWHIKESDFTDLSTFNCSKG
jgi:hypothetical protein